jgi:hypothetical protein
MDNTAMRPVSAGKLSTGFRYEGELVQPYLLELPKWLIISSGGGSTNSNLPEEGDFAFF